MKIQLFCLLIAGISLMLSPRVSAENIPTPQPSMAVVKRYFDNNQYEEALPLLDTMIKSNPNNADALSIRGSIYYFTNRTQMALVDLDKALQLNPKLSENHVTKGMILMEMKEIEKAIESFNQALKITSYKEPAALYGRGMAYSLTERYKESVLDLITAEELGYPVNTEVFNAIYQKSLTQKSELVAEPKSGNLKAEINNEKKKQPETKSKAVKATQLASAR